jgi:hypothetical protein
MTCLCQCAEMCLERSPPLIGPAVVTVARHNRRRTAAGVLIGLVAGVTWIILAFFPTECAPPTESSEVFCNRLWTPALAGMLTGFSALFVRIRSLLSRAAILGFAGLLVGFVLMVAGNFSEYWFLNDLPHAGPDGRIRAVAFMTLLFGFLLVLTGASVCGIASLRGARSPTDGTLVHVASAANADPRRG